MLKVSPSSSRKGALVFGLAAMLALFGATGQSTAKNKNSNASDTGLANGVAHRVAALEGLIDDVNDDIAMLMSAVSDLQNQVDELTDANADLQVQVEDLQVQVADQQVQIDELDARLTAGGL